jgi:hypothetical protein
MELAVFDDDIVKAILDDRNREVRELESQMTDLANIFRDLSEMLYDHGEKIDVSALHVETAETNIIITEQHLEKAAVTKNNVQSFYWKGALVCGGFVLGGVGLAFWIPIAGIVTSGVAATGAVSMIGLALKRK